MEDNLPHPLAEYKRVPIPYQEHEYVYRFGVAPPPDIWISSAGEVAFGVGAKVLTHQYVRSFAECLSYLRDDTLGTFNAPLDINHPLAVWLAISRARSNPEIAVGATFLVAHFNYCLYIVREHSTPPRQWLRRLRLADQFPGAFLELRLAAAFLVRGMEVQYAGEAVSVAKPEFDVTPRGATTRFGIEAKSRVRKTTVTREYVDSGMKDVMKRVREGASKTIPYPFVVFVELSLPWGLGQDGCAGPTNGSLFEDLFREAVSQEWWSPRCRALVFLNSTSGDFLDRELPNEELPNWVIVKTTDSAANDRDTSLVLNDVIAGLRQSASIPEIEW